MLYSIFSIKISLLALWNKVNIAALKIHIWAKHLVFAECSFFFFFLSLFYLLRIKPFRNLRISMAASFWRTSGNVTVYIIPKSNCLLLGERFQVDSIFKNSSLVKERQVLKILDMSELLQIVFPFESKMTHIVEIQWIEFWSWNHLFAQ